MLTCHIILITSPSQLVDIKFTLKLKYHKYLNLLQLNGLWHSLKISFADLFPIMQRVLLFSAFNWSACFAQFGENDPQ